MAIHNHEHIYDSKRFGGRLVFVCIKLGCSAMIRGVRAS